MLLLAFAQPSKLLETKNSDARAVVLSKKAVAIMRDIVAAGITITAGEASTLFRKVRDKINAEAFGVRTR